MILITRQKIGQSGNTATIIVAISFFRLPFGDKDKSLLYLDKIIRAHDGISRRQGEVVILPWPG